MIVGFTGTRGEITTPQKHWVAMMLVRLKATELHHGDCIGSDAIAHELAVSLGLAVVIHPPLDPKARAYCQSDIVLPPRPYLVRNHDIVKACDVLLATPAGGERLRSGTWATIRYARKVHLRHYVFPAF